MSEIQDAIKLADKLQTKATELLYPLEREMRLMKWPDEYQAIMWEVIASIALERASNLTRTAANAS